MVRFILILGVFLLACSPEKQSDVQKNNPISTIQDFHNAIKKDPNNPLHYANRAEFLFKKNQINEALEDINVAIKIDPSVAKFHYIKARILFDQAKVERKILFFEKSQLYLRQALRIDPLYTDANVLMAKLYIYQKDHQKALDHLDVVLRDNPKLWEPYFLKGLIFQRENNFQLAQSSYQTALEMNGENYDVLCALGHLYTLDTNENGLIYLNEAIELKPSQIEPVRNKGLLLKNLQKPQKAIETFKTILNIDSSFAEAYYNIGVCFMETYTISNPQKPIDSALYYFEKAIAIEPKYTLALYNIGHLYEFQNKKEKALYYYKKCVNSDPDYPLVLEALRRF